MGARHQWRTNPFSKMPTWPPRLEFAGKIPKPWLETKLSTSPRMSCTSAQALRPPQERITHGVCARNRTTMQESHDTLEVGRGAQCNYSRLHKAKTMMC